MGCSNSKDLFQMGNGGYAVFRLPALVYHNGVFLAFCEGRMGIADDSVSEIVMRRGIQQGADITWTDIQVVAKIEGVRLSNPVPFVDKEKDTIWVMYKRPGTEEHPTSLFLIKSTDLGVTWSDPRDIRETIFNQMPKDVISFTPGPAHGIQMKSKRLVIPGSVWVKGPSENSEDKTDHATVLLSDDHGETWYPGGQVPLETANGTTVDTNETSAVELADDTLCLNSRTLGKDQPRAQSFSNDGGITFNPPQLVSTLFEPQNCGDVPAGCQGCVLNFKQPESAQTWVLFSNPACTSLRLKMSIRMSKDGCVSWSKPWQIRWFASGYSDMTQYEDSSGKGKNTDQEQNPTFAILYENGLVRSYAQVTFQTFNLSDVTQGIKS